MGRFIVIVCLSFLTAFIGVAWATRGFPIPVLRVAPLSPTVDAHFGDDHAKEGLRKDWEAEHSAAGDDDAKRNAIRLDTLQAANAYAMSPCDRTVKANLVDALTAYVRAWQAKLGCKGATFGLKICSDQQIKEAAETVNTPLDHRVKEALHAAVSQKGIVSEDFPSDVRKYVGYFTGPDIWMEPSPICLPRQLGSANPSP